MPLFCGMKRIGGARELLKKNKYASTCRFMTNYKQDFLLQQRAQVVVLSGPTAVGKSKIGIELKNKLGGILINGDSTKVYQGLNIGANKYLNSQDGMELWDIINPISGKSCSAGLYFDLAMDRIHNALNRGKLPIVVGGSGLYLKWLVNGKLEGPVRDPALSTAIRAEILSTTSSWDEAIKLVQAFDPKYASTIQKNDYRRTVRAIEIYRKYRELETDSTATTSNSQRNTSQNVLSSRIVKSENSMLDFRCFVLTMDRKKLYDRICSRCEDIIQAGLFLEVWNLMKQNLNEDSPPGKAVGYRQTIKYIKSRHFTEDSFHEYLLDFQAKSRQLAHRQLTWLRKQKGYCWIDVENLDCAADKIIDLITLPRDKWDCLMEIQDREKKTTCDMSEKMKTYIPFSKIFRVDKKLKKLNPLLYRQKIAESLQATDIQLKILNSIYEEMHAMDCSVQTNSTQENFTEKASD